MVENTDNAGSVSDVVPSSLERLAWWRRGRLLVTVAHCVVVVDVAELGESPHRSERTRRIFRVGSGSNQT